MSKWYEIEVCLRKHVLVEVRDGQHAPDATVVIQEEVIKDLDGSIGAIQPIDPLQLEAVKKRCDEVLSL